MLRKLLSTAAILALPLAASATEYRIVEHPRQECWSESVPVQSIGYGGPIVGGIVGGLLGNQVGGGTGRVVATAAGAMTGAIVGDRLSSPSTSYETVQRCRTVVETEQVPVYREPAIVYREPVPVYAPVYYVEPVRPYWGYSHGWHGHEGHHGHRD